jgi:hypothetical protein
MACRNFLVSGPSLRINKTIKNSLFVRSETFGRISRVLCGNLSKTVGALVKDIVIGADLRLQHHAAGDLQNPFDLGLAGTISRAQSPD